MVRGLEKFRAQLGAYASQYVLIGGAASDLLMNEAGLEFRATKDLDIVLCVETLDVSFVNAFWEFVKSGKYEIQQGTTGKARYYRFLKPKDSEYPYMLELFSRKPDGLYLPDGCHLTPIPVDEEVSSLSAILLNDDYYAFLHSGKQTVNGVSVVGPEQLTALKARAWLDLKSRSEAGEKIDTKSIVKHKNDVFRLYQLLDPTLEVVIPDAIREDMDLFLNAMKSERVDLNNLGIRGQTLDGILQELRGLFVGNQLGR
ncbi:MAG TPA: hypothetical protein VHS28_10070 [Chloroflexota bacterium]|nr:hypothetical protein [Chloroflexota bacterium]